MQLLNMIHETSCPICSSPITEERREHRHCNGYYNEYRKFECGCVLHFSPNYMKVIEDKICPNEEEEKIKRKKRQIATEKLKKYIEKLDVDHKWKEKKLIYL